MQQSKGLVVVVDDDEDIRLALSMLLSNQGYQVLEANGQVELARITAQHRPGLVLLDMNFSRDTTSGLEGLDILHQLNQQGLPTILMTAWGNIELAVKGIQAGAADFIEKPWNNQKLLRLVDSYIHRPVSVSKPQEKTEHSESCQSQANGWVAESASMQALESMVEQVADTQASVLILGENGTGKSLLAQRIHELSERRESPFVSVNMGAVSDNLFESELFGHVKGAFTDARDNRKGRFELAQNGTLFLDEIGALPTQVQPKLLRVLESGEFEPVGTSTTYNTDVRVISATNADIESMVATGEFRQDLLFRLNTFVLVLPPLRERLDDIIPLSNNFIDKFVAKYVKPNITISDEVVALFQAYAWPGNVRELSHVIERAVILCRDTQILPTHIMLSEKASSVVFEGNGMNDPLRPLDDVELDMITKALRKYQGHISKAASALGISRNALYRRMEKHGLEKEDFDIE